MKVAYINTVFEVKSTGRTYLELKNYLSDNGHEVQVHYGRGNSKIENSFLIQSKFSYYFHNLLSRLFGLEGYFSFFATKRLVRRLKRFNPDIIHIGSMHGHYLHLPTLFKYLNKVQKPTFITTHDCWSFTGNCSHYNSVGCSKFETGCYKCPVKKEYPSSYTFDCSKKLYKEKKKGLCGLKNLNIICVSEWMKTQVKRSFLKDKDIFVNYNWINTNVFKPLDKNERTDFRKENGFSDNDFVIIAVSSIWGEGTPRFEDLKKLISKLKDNQKLVVIGSMKKELSTNERVTFIPFVSDIKLLAKYYSMADVFVHFSIEDTFGKVIAEAQACGTPAIVYNATACSEIARIGNGYVCEPRDVDQVYKMIEKLSKMDKAGLTSDRIVRAEKTSQTLNKNTRIKNLLKLYKQAIENKISLTSKEIRDREI